MKRLCAIVHWFGPAPHYARLFYQTVAANPDLDVLLVGDAPSCELPPNVRHLPCTPQELCVRLQRTLGTSIGYDQRPGQPYKLCDYRPAFGEVFADELDGYERWAFLDSDHILGDVLGMMDREGGRDADVFCVRGTWWVSGAFSVFRNTPLVNALYRRAPDYAQRFASPDYEGFDESCFRFDGVTRRVEDLVALGLPVSFTDVVREAEAAGDVRLVMPHITADPNVFWDKRYHYRWEDGRITDLQTGDEVFGVHLVRSKKEPLFGIDTWEALPVRFDVSRLGVTAVGPSGERNWLRDTQVIAQGLPRATRHAAGRAKARVLSVWSRVGG